MFQVAWGKTKKTTQIRLYNPQPTPKKNTKSTQKTTFTFNLPKNLPFFFLVFQKNMTPGAFLPLAASPDPRGPGLRRLRLPRGAIPPWKPCWIGGVHALV